VTAILLFAVIMGLVWLLMELDDRHYFDHIDLVAYATAYDTIKESTR
jgi:hypothetical protein